MDTSKSDERTGEYLDCSPVLVKTPKIALWSAIKASKQHLKSRTHNHSNDIGRTVRWLTVGVLAALWGISSLIWKPYDLISSERMAMRPGMPAYEWWADPPDSVYLSVYVFNITNSKEFISGKDKKLKMDEIGPIVYKEKLSHTDIEIGEDGVLRYTSSRWTEYQPELNTIDLNATIYVPNLAVLGMASYLWNSAFTVKLGFNLLVNQMGSQPIVKVTIQQYLWNLTDPVSSAASKFLPHLVPKNNFGVLDQIYEKYSDRIGVLIGEKNGPRKFFHIESFNGQPGIGAWKNASCDSLQGSSEGASYHMNMEPNETVWYLRKAFCRKAPLYFTGEHIMSGMTVYKYELSNKTFTRPTEGRDCFLQDRLPSLPSGLTDASPCFYNYPLAVSFPHFMKGDPVLLEKIEGLKPNYSKHHSYIYVEPETGVPLSACARVQCNLVIRPFTSGFSKLKPFYNMSIPMFWAEYKFEDLPWKITALTYFTVVIVHGYQTYFSILLLVFSAFSIYRASRSKTHSTQLPPDPAQNALLEIKLTEKNIL